MIMNGDTFGDYFLSTELLNIMFNVVIYVWFNGVAAPFFWLKIVYCQMFLINMYCWSMGKSCVITRKYFNNFDGLK